jgi:hypothetical protein
VRGRPFLNECGELHDLGDFFSSDAHGFGSGEVRLKIRDAVHREGRAQGLVATRRSAVTDVALVQIAPRAEGMACHDAGGHSCDSEGDDSLLYLRVGRPSLARHPDMVIRAGFAACGRLEIGW